MRSDLTINDNHFSIFLFFSFQFFLFVSLNFLPLHFSASCPSCSEIESSTLCKHNLVYPWLCLTMFSYFHYKLYAPTGEPRPTSCICTQGHLWFLSTYTQYKGSGACLLLSCFCNSNTHISWFWLQTFSFTQTDFSLLTSVILSCQEIHFHMFTQLKSNLLPEAHDI